MDRPPDFEITREVIEAYRAEPALDGVDLAVRTVNGSVRLYGWLFSTAQLRLCKQLAYNVAGVWDVTPRVGFRAPVFAKPLPMRPAEPTVEPGRAA